MLTNVTRTVFGLSACPSPSRRREQEVVEVYERNAAAVVNIFDITLQARLVQRPMAQRPSV